MIAGSVPNKERIMPNMHEADVLGDFPPAHFTRWSKRSIGYFLASQGFEGLVTVPFGFDSIRDITGWIRSHVLSGFTRFLKTLILGRRGHLSAGAGNSGGAQASRKAAAGAIKFVSDMVFLPFAVIMYPVYKRRGSHLYFQATLKGADQ